MSDNLNLSGRFVFTLLVIFLLFCNIRCTKYESADNHIENISNLIKESPNDTSNYFLRAHLYESIHDYWNSRADYTKIIQIDSLSKDAYIFRGFSYFYDKYYPEAVRDFSKAIAIDSTLAGIYYARAQSYEGMRNLNAAILDWSRCIQLRPEISSPYDFRGDDFRILGRNQEAIDDYKKLVTLYDARKDTDIYISDKCINLAEILSIEGEHREGLIFINKALSSSKVDSSRLLYYRGVLNYRLGEYETAAKDLQMSIHNDDYYGIPHYYLSIINSIMGQRQSALNNYALAVEYGFQDTDLYRSNSIFQKFGIMDELDQITTQQTRNTEYISRHKIWKKFLDRDTLISNEKKISLIFYRMHEICMEPAKQAELQKLLLLQRESSDEFRTIAEH